MVCLRSENVPVTGPMMMQQAKIFHKDMNTNACEYLTGWLKPCKKRQGFDSYVFVVNMPQPITRMKLFWFPKRNWLLNRYTKSTNEFVKQFNVKNGVWSTAQTLWIRLCELIFLRRLLFLCLLFIYFFYILVLFTKPKNRSTRCKKHRFLGNQHNTGSVFKTETKIVTASVSKLKDFGKSSNHYDDCEENGFWLFDCSILKKCLKTLFVLNVHIQDSF